MRHKIALSVLGLGLVLLAVAGPGFLIASDHDDGEVDTKGRNLNLTDLYVFREGDQTGNLAQNSHLILVINTNPRSVARQQYYFSTRARYEFNVTRVPVSTATPTGRVDVVLRFEFGPPSPTTSQQAMRITAIRDGATQTATGALTTSINMVPVNNAVSLGGQTLTVFAGLREDPFFFDVEQYFRVRAGVLGLGPAVTFRSPVGLDFTAGYNVNSIVVRVPIAFLQGTTGVTTFDVWATISVPGEGVVPGGGSSHNQVERLARPAINEGLFITNDFLNTMNRIGPDFEAAALAGQQPQATILAPIFAEAIALLTALGNSSTQIGGIVAAFLPDVMRIDTTIPSGYASGATFDAFGNITSSPKGGRKLLDDVIDITLGVLIPGGFPAGPPIANLESDNVSYVGPNLGGSGHQPLLPVFPYLAPPN